MDILNTHPHQYMPDRGCRHAATCLDCLLPQCVLDLPQLERHAVVQDRVKRDRQIADLLDAGENLSQIAWTLGVDRRTVMRARDRIILNR